VGRDVRWTPQFVEYASKDILVVTVEPPEFGDPIRTMLKSHQSDRGLRVRNGDVYVRSHGRTDLATQADFDMLTERFAASREQIGGVRVEALGTTSAVPVAYGPEEIQAWCSRKRASLKPFDPLSFVVGGRPFGDDRTAAEYMEEVDSWIKEAASVLTPLAHTSALDGRAPGLRLRLTNGTEHNFAAVRVKVGIEGCVFAYLDPEEDRPWIPSPPRSWGTRRMPTLSFPSDLTSRGETFLPTTPDVDNYSNPTTIEFDDVDLRPSSTVELAPIYLATTADLAGTALSAKWTATSSSVDKVARGELPVEVVPEAIEVYATGSAT
jgi:hypothetical protein